MHRATVLVGDLVLDRTCLLGHMLRRDSQALRGKVTCNDNLEKPGHLFKKGSVPRQDRLRGEFGSCNNETLMCWNLAVGVIAESCFNVLVPKVGRLTTQGKVN